MTLLALLDGSTEVEHLRYCRDDSSFQFVWLRLNPGLEWHKSIAKPSVEVGGGGGAARSSSVPEDPPLRRLLVDAPSVVDGFIILVDSKLN